MPRVLRAGLLLDIVPNHMAASGENRWWMDVLESGGASPFSTFFDIDWQPPKKALQEKVLLPVLGEPYGRILENQELTLRLEKSGFFVHYYGTKLPLSLRSYARVLAHRIESFEETYGAEHPAFLEFWELIRAIEHLPYTEHLEPGPTRVPGAGPEQVKRALWDLCRRRAEIRTFVEENVRLFNGRKNEPESFSLLDRLLAEQAYWLSFWRLANEEINYRRFFAISDLVSLRVEDPRVFDAAHALVLRLVREGKVTGFRIDHIDGLYDPQGYLEQLMDRLNGDGAGDGKPAGFYVVVEKILAEDETLPADWPVCGTTGYDFLNLVNRVFVSAAGARTLDAVYTRFLGRKLDFDDVAYEKKKLVMESLFAGEMHALGQHLGTLAEHDRHGRDLPRKELRQAVVEVTACFPVYRTYIRSTEISARDRLYLGRALKEARRRAPELSAAVFDFLRRVLMLENPRDPEGGQVEKWLAFLRRWQQFTSPIMAKGHEDTALYVFNRLVSLNDVGANPLATSVAPKAFHQRMQAALRWPHGLNATATHDTKRSEDVRSRINVLSELPEEWERHLLLWRGLNEKKKRLVMGEPAPDRNEEILLYQTLLGAWPLDPRELPGLAQRIKDYMVKALREAKVHTRWIRPKPEHERAVTDFVDALLESGGKNRFLADFVEFQRKISHFGMINSLSQLLLKLAAPGIPDFYQGTELWNFRLVDPDNRSPVDFSAAAGLLSGLEEGEQRGAIPLVNELMSHANDGRIKMYVTWKGLRFRRANPDLFRAGDYQPLAASGEKKEHVLAFARLHAGRAVIVAVPRLATRLVARGEFPLGEKTWGNRAGIVLPKGFPGRWRNIFTGEELECRADRKSRSLPLCGVFGRFPLALLEALP